MMVGGVDRAGHCSWTKKQIHDFIREADDGTDRNVKGATTKAELENKKRTELSARAGQFRAEIAKCIDKEFNALAWPRTGIVWHTRLK